VNVPALIVGLYPPAIRQRWGNEMTREVATSGPRSWLDTVIGAARLWMHPSDWPETMTGQTRRVLAVALFAVATVAALLLRADGQPSASLPADLTHPAASAWLAVTLAGVALAAPFPPLRWGALGRLVAATVRTLAVPVLALLAMYLAAHSGLIGQPTGMVHVLLLGYYWTTLGSTGLCLCALMARIGRIAIMPSTRRLCLALLLIGAGLALAACQSLAATPLTTLHAGTLAVSCGLAVLATAVIVTGQDLLRAHHQPPEPHPGSLDATGRLP
jgi:hypothetical protein